MSETQVKPASLSGSPKEAPEEVFLSDEKRFPYVVCAFYTQSYREDALRLKESLEELGFDYYLRLYPDRESWERNTMIKPEFILACLEKFPDRDVVCLDADCVVRKPMPLFATLTTDLGIYFITKTGRYKTRFLRPLPGTLFVKNTETARSFLRHWRDAGNQDDSRLINDQDSFVQALQKTTGLSLTLLPPAYVKIFDKGGEDPIVEHFQASRDKPKWRARLHRMRNLTFIGGLTILILALILGWLFS